MDRRERYPNLYAHVQALIDTALIQTWVALPGIVQSFNATDCTAEVQLAILMQKRDKNSDWTDITPSPVIPKAIVQFYGNHDYLLTVPLKKGDEGLLVFADRCVDGWWQNGEVQRQLDIRQHDLTDAFFLPGFRSKVNVPSNINGAAAEFRTFSGNTAIAFNDANGFTLKGNVKIVGSLAVTQSVTAGFGGADSVTVQNHIHPSNGSPPTPGT